MFQEILKKRRNGVLLDVNYLELSMASYSFDELLETQMNDEDISLIIKYLNNKESYVKGYLVCIFKFKS